MNSREIEYIDKISFELSQIRKNLNELSAIIDVVAIFRIKSVKLLKRMFSDNCFSEQPVVAIVRRSSSYTNEPYVICKRFYK